MEVPSVLQDCYQEVLEKLCRHTVVFLDAPPGIGKSTSLLRLLTNQVRGRILCCNPKTKSTEANATYVARTSGWTLGREVGYVTEDGRAVSPASRLVYTTYGCALHLDDAALRQNVLIVLDEPHDRAQSSADLFPARVKKLSGTLLARSRVLILSATMPASICLHFGSAKEDSVVRVPATALPWRRDPLFAVEPVGVGHLAEHVVGAVLDWHLWLWPQTTDAGGILVFLPTVGLISAVQKRLQSNGLNDVCRLFSGMVDAACRAVDEPPECGRRAVVLSTDVAESSRTIPWVTLVVDSGLHNFVHCKSGVRTEELAMAPKASLLQRQGRVDRTHVGFKVCLFTRAAYDEQQMHADPPFLTGDVENYLFQMLVHGLDLHELPEALPSAALHAGVRKLLDFGLVELKDGVDCFDDKSESLLATCRLTCDGVSCARLRLDDVLHARLLLECWKAGLQDVGIAVAACAGLQLFSPLSDADTADRERAAERAALFSDNTGLEAFSKLYALAAEDTDGTVDRFGGVPRAIRRALRVGARLLEELQRWPRDAEQKPVTLSEVLRRCLEVGRLQGRIAGKPCYILRDGRRVVCPLVQRPADEVAVLSLRRTRDGIAMERWHPLAKATPSGCRPTLLSGAQAARSAAVVARPALRVLPAEPAPPCSVGGRHRIRSAARREVPKYQLFQAAAEGCLRCVRRRLENSDPSSAVDPFAVSDTNGYTVRDFAQWAAERKTPGAADVQAYLDVHWADVPLR